ncbi:Mce protein [Mycobacterium sp.]|uniref:Mce protein n=1 Tax=Mycobacterium sp. TaxID=1785 RepID=UPI003D10A24C
MSADFVDGSDELENAEREEEDLDAAPAAEKRNRSPVRVALAFGLLTVTALAGVLGWLSFQAYEAHRAEQQRQLFLQVGRQGAINLTTVNYQHADADITRILESSTGTLYENFQKRAQPFMQLIQQIKATTVGNVSEAGLESANDKEAQVLVIVKVQRTIGGNQQDPVGWRMRLNVQKVGNEAKVSNVEFVS